MKSLVEQFKAIRILEPPEMSFFWGLIAEMESACPSKIWQKRQIGKIRRAARLTFVSRLTGRQIESFRQLWGAELWLLSEWFETHQAEYEQWCVENRDAIYELGGIVIRKETEHG